MEEKDKIEKIIKIITNGQYEVATSFFNNLPPRENVKEELKKKLPFNLSQKEELKVVLVEDLGDYKIFIQIPGEKRKSEMDFIVWKVVFEENKIKEIKIPSHDDLAKFFLELKSMSSNLEEFLINALIRYLRDRISLSEIIDKYFKKESENTLKEIKKFFITLKWIAIQEDVNYPPPKYLGSLYILSIFALLEVFGDMKVIRKIIRFK